MEGKNKKQSWHRKPISTFKAVVIYILCGVLIAGMLVGNYFADAYRELITVYLSGSGSVTTAESEALCLEIEEEGITATPMWAATICPTTPMTSSSPWSCLAAS